MNGFLAFSLILAGILSPIWLALSIKQRSDYHQGRAILLKESYSGNYHSYDFAYPWPQNRAQSFYEVTVNAEHDSPETVTMRFPEGKPQAAVLADQAPEAGSAIVTARLIRKSMNEKASQRRNLQIMSNKLETQGLKIPGQERPDADSEPPLKSWDITYAFAWPPMEQQRWYKASDSSRSGADPEGGFQIFVNAASPSEAVVNLWPLGWPIALTSLISLPALFVFGLSVAKGTRRLSNGGAEASGKKESGARKRHRNSSEDW